MWKFHSLHAEDLYLADCYGMMIGITIASIDWHHIIVSLQIYLPIIIWIMTVYLPIVHWSYKMCFPGWYISFREVKRLDAVGQRKKMESKRERARTEDIEQGQQIKVQVEADAREESALIR
jgi:hypothetical protein